MRAALRADSHSSHRVQIAAVQTLRDVILAGREQQMQVRARRVRVSMHALARIDRTLTLSRACSLCSIPPRSPF